MHTNGEPMQAYIPNFIFAQSNSFRFALKTSGSDNLWVSIFPAISRSMILCLCTAETPPQLNKVFALLTNTPTSAISATI